MTALRLLLFRTGGQVFAVEAGAVREILPATPSTRIPGAPAAVRGLANVRGSLVTVVDTALAIGVAAAPGVATEGDDRGGSVVLVQQGSHRVGLAVDEVLDLVTVDDAALQQRASLPGCRAGVVRAAGSADGRRFYALATDVLLEPLLP
jgi:purine-binding chemotaxis protein CheW